MRFNHFFATGLHDSLALVVGLREVLGHGPINMFVRHHHGTQRFQYSAESAAIRAETRTGGGLLMKPEKA